MSDGIKNDCKWLNDVECPYATGYQECEICDKYEKDDRPHPLDDSDRGCEKYHNEKIIKREKKND